MWDSTYPRGRHRLNRSQQWTGKNAARRAQGFAEMGDYDWRE